MTPVAQDDLRLAVSAVAQWLDRVGASGALIGAVAVAALGRPRATRDVDVVVWSPFATEWPTLIDGLGDHLAFREGGSLEFALESRVLLLRHVPTGVDVDVSLGALELERELVEGARLNPASGLALALPRVEHLVILKAIAARPRDIVDIEGLLQVHPDLDRAYVRRVVVEMGELLEAPLADSLDAVMKRVPAGLR